MGIRPVELEDHRVPPPLILPVMTGPAHPHRPKEFRKVNGKGQGAELIGNELGSGEKVQEGVSQEKAGRQGLTLIQRRRLG